MKKHFIHLAILFFTALSLAACSEKGPETPADDQPVQGTPVTNVSEVIDFCKERAAANDYCVKLSGENSLTISTKYANSIKVEGTCRIFEVNASENLVYNKQDKGIKIDVRESWYTAPESSVGDNGNITVMGTDTGVSATGLHAINCGKFIWFYSENETVAVPSEIAEPFNPPLPRNKETLKVLFVGNSFNQDATEHLPGMLAANGTKKVYMGRTYVGGETVVGYLNNFDSNTHCSYLTCAPGESSWKGNDATKDHGLRMALLKEDWDIVTFMEYSGNYDMLDGWNAVARSNGVRISDNVKEFINKIFEAKQNKRPTVMFLLPQGNTSKQKIVHTMYGGNPIGHYNVIVNYGKELLNGTCIDDIIPTCTTTQNIRTTYLNEPLPDSYPAGETKYSMKHECSRDGFHLDYGTTRYAAACTMWYKIFEPVLGLDLSTNTYRYNVSNNTTTPVTDENVELLRKAAKLAVEQPFKYTDMSKM